MSEREPPKLPELPEPRVPNTHGGPASFSANQMLSYGTACFEAGVKAGRESIFGKPEPKDETGGR